jgi:uncharacterized damage-inducible protein DinB
MPNDSQLREQLIRILSWEEAHVGFDKAVADLPAEKRGALAAGFDHSIWQLVEHLRLAQADILDFCVNRAYVHSMKWPDDYWPSAAPADAQMWDRSLASYRHDRDRVAEVTRETPDLFALVPTGKGTQTYLRTLLLLADHNSYHVGQIVAVRRAVGAWHG